MTKPLTLEEKAARAKAKVEAAKKAVKAKAPDATSKLADAVIAVTKVSIESKKPAAKKAAAAPADFDLSAAAEAEVSSGQSATEEGGLKRVVELGQKMLQAEQKMNAAEQAFTEAKEAYRAIEQGLLPDLMTELGLPMFKLADGSVFELVEDVQCGITEERRPAAHRWIRDNGFEGLIKTEIKTTFSPDQLDAADALEQDIRDHGMLPERKEAIHAARLKSFIKEQLAAGTKVPFDLFGIHPFNKVKYKQPKGKR